MEYGCDFFKRRFSGIKHVIMSMFLNLFVREDDPSSLLQESIIIALFVREDDPSSLLQENIIFAGFLDSGIRVQKPKSVGEEGQCKNKI
ncbi:hypothetical protein L1887_37853 [Cichorium endivia]|nr:hypothetical protein L1887_37853 [Cichorium endivia]